MSFKNDIKVLSNQCFSIEDKLESFFFGGHDNQEQNLRRELYRIRIAINGLTRYAEMVDEERKENAGTPV